MAVFIRFDLEPNDDEEITCIFCNLPKCDKCFETRAGGRLAVHGVHGHCADAHEERKRKGSKTVSK